MNIKEVDYLIVGAGLAGLSLACQLTKHCSSNETIVILDSKDCFEEDRTWCYFDVEEHQFSDLVSRRWSSWSVRTPREDVTVSGSNYRYCMIRSGDLYSRAESLLSKFPNFELRFSEAVCEFKNRVGLVEVQTEDSLYLCRQVFDSRSRNWGAELSGSKSPYLLQQFMGWVVDIEAPGSLLFDSDTAVLMDFNQSYGDAISFVYRLPLDENKFLLEATVFVKELVVKEVLERMLLQSIESSGLKRWSIASKESGVIPMSVTPYRSRNNGRVMDIGLRAGCARPSSGYAFLNIQRDSSQIAESLSNRQGRIARYEYPSADLWMDETLLAVLNQQPGVFRELMPALFKNCESDSLVRFMSGKAEVFDYASVARAMPLKHLFISRAGEYSTSLKECEK